MVERGRARVRADRMRSSSRSPERTGRRRPRACSHAMLEEAAQSPSRPPATSDSSDRRDRDGSAEAAVDRGGGLELPARDDRDVPAEGRGHPEHRGGSHGLARIVRRATRRQGAHLREPDARRCVASPTPTTIAWSIAWRARQIARRCRSPRRAPDGGDRASTGDRIVFGAARRSSRRRRPACRARRPRGRDRGRRSRARLTGSIRRAVARAIKGFRAARRTGWRSSPRRTAITYIDDSKATNPHATLAAVAGSSDVVLIAGGRSKGIDLSPLAPTVPPVIAVVALGEAARRGRTRVRGIGTGRASLRDDGRRGRALRIEICSSGGSVLLVTCLCEPGHVRELRARAARTSHARCRGYIGEQREEGRRWRRRNRAIAGGARPTASRRAHDPKTRASSLDRGHPAVLLSDRDRHSRVCSDS